MQELEEPDFHHFFVKKTCTLAMDKHGRCGLGFQSIHQHAKLVLMPSISLPRKPVLLLRHAGGCSTSVMDAECFLTLRPEPQLCSEMTLAPQLLSALHK